MTRHRVPGTSAPPRVLIPLVLIESIPDDAPEHVKNALAIRNAASIAGVCPDCGTRGELTGPDGLGIYHLTFPHEPDCGALLDEAAA